MVLSIITSIWPQDERDFRGEHCYDQAEALASLGIKLEVLILRGAPFGRKVMPWVRSFPFLKPRVATCRYIPTKLLLFPGAFKVNCLLASRALTRINTNVNADAILLHSVRYSGLAVPFVKSLSGLPVVQVLHGFDSYIVKNVNKKVVQQCLVKWRNRVSKFVLVGNILLSYTDTLGIPRDATIVLANGFTGIRKENEHALRTENENGLLRKSDSILVCSISHFGLDKGLHITLSALAKVLSYKLPFNVCYQIIGTGARIKDLRKLIKALRIESCVELLGPLPHQEALRKISVCDIFCLPSWNEPFGLVYLEAMSLGLPVIGCFGTGAEETVRNGIDGFLIPGKDVDACAKAIYKLAIDEDLRKRMGKNGQERSAEYSWQRNAKEMWNLIDNINCNFQKNKH